MKQYLGALVIPILFLTGCSTSRSVLCFAPVKPFEPQSGRELLAAFNQDVPFDVSPQRFACKAKSEGLVGWVIVSGDTQKEAAKEALRQSRRLKLLQIESLDPQFGKMIRKQWRQSLDARPPNKRDSGDVRSL